MGEADFHGLVVNLHVTEIQWSDVAITASVEFGRVSTHPSLKKRLDIDFDFIHGLNLGVTIENTTQIDLTFTPRLQIYPFGKILSWVDTIFPSGIPFVRSEERRVGKEC